MDKTQPFEVPSGRVARGRVTAPPSKSHAIRVLIIAALGDGESRVVFPSGPISKDVLDTIAALQALGVSIERRGDLEFTVHGTRGVIPKVGATLDLGGSGTALRFLAAVAALGPGPTTLTGDVSLRSRPAGAIIPALRDLGVSVNAVCGPDGMAAPFTVEGGPPRRSEVEVDASESSHVVSALLLIGPVLPHGIVVRTKGDVASRPYIDLTWNTMAVMGGTPPKQLDGGYAVESGGYPRTGLKLVEGDWSSCSYIAAAAAVTNGHVVIDGAYFDSDQADERIVDMLADYGCTVDLREDTASRNVTGFIGNDRRPLDVDLRDAPDLAPLVGALGCVASGTTRVRGAAHLRLKESDRIATVVAAARALGCEAHELPDGFTITGPARHGGTIETKHDHRIAMAFAVAGLAVPGVVIDDPACVAKSYPGFWDDLARLIGVDTEAPR